MKNAPKPPEATENTTFRYRLHPTPEQAKLFEKTFFCCRYLWNEMLSDEREFYFAADEHYIPTPARYKKGAPFLREVDSQALATVHQNLRRAFQRFFDSSDPCGYPVFKRKSGGKNSYTTYNNAQGTRIYLTKNGIRLPKLGIVKAVLHRRPLHWWKLKSATVTKTPSGNYFCSLLYEYPVKETPVPPREPERAIGINYSASHFYADSEGNTPDLPQWLERAEQKLSRMQKRLAKMRPGSRNYEEQLHKIRKQYEHISNQRLDFAHKESKRLADTFDAVCVKDIDLKEAAKSVKLGKVYDTGFGKFRLCLQYKFARRRKPYIVVDKFFPSARTCHICGRTRDAFAFTERTWKCPSCGANLSRERNAAENIKKQGMIQFRTENET